MEIIKFAKGDYPNIVNGQKMTLTKAAVALYEDSYRSLRSPFNSELLSAMLERRAPYALRMAMEFALTDLTYEIDECHLEAAMSWVNYATDSVKYVFSDKSYDPRLVETRKNANKIMEFLRARSDSATMTALNNDCFHKNISSEKIKASLEYLLAENPPLIEQQIIEQKNGKGRHKTIFVIKKSVTDK